MNFPVILLIDNDDGAKQIFGLLNSKKFNITINHATETPFYHLDGPLYLVKTPSIGENHKSCPEDFFEQKVRDQEIGGKKFNPNKEHEAPDEFGKVVFAERVRSQAHTIDFSGFNPILQRLEAVLDDYARVRGLLSSSELAVEW
jgi:RNA-directed DNA polymerase